MFQIYTCVTQDHDLRLVLLAALICAFATYTGFSLVARAQIATHKARSNWLVGAALALGCGIWATHFVAMLAYKQPVPMGYELLRTSMSIVISILVAGIGLAVAVSGGAIARLVGGSLLGAGVGAMHYTGMAALKVPGVIHYDQDLVVASLAVGLVLGAVAVSLAGPGASLSRRILASVLLTLGISGLHFTGMAATHIVYSADLTLAEAGVAPALLAVAVTAVTILILVLSLCGSIIDEHLTRRALLEGERLRASERRFKALADATFEGVLIHDNGIIIDANAAMCALVGYALTDLVNKPLLEFIDPGQRGHVKERLALAHAHLDAADDAAEVVLSHRDGTAIPVEVLARAIDYSNATLRVVAVRDLRERKKAEERIHHLAHHDTLTGLPNRRMFLDRLAQTLALAQRNGTHVAVFCLDLDRFKSVNDLLGHAGGDELLRSVATRLLQNVRSHDTVARLSGDEFVIIQTEAVMPDGPASLADRLLKAIGESYQLGDQSMGVSTSIGVALFPGDATTGEELVRAADTALYRAKEAGRNTVRFFEAAMDVRLQERARLERDLREALVKEQLEVYYQPLVGCASGSTVGFEALVRWQHPERGTIGPNEFIPLAELCGLILPLGSWVLRTACRAALTWPDDVKVAVNLSPVQFRHGDLVAEVLSILQETGLPACRLELEITEGVLMADTERTLDILTGLKDAGISISLDDFGTGYSSLSYLQRFPFDKMKIDRSFIWAMEGNPDSMSIVRAVIALGHSLNITVTAEGVETDAQLAQLRGEHCDQVQGYLLGRPAPLRNVQVVFPTPVSTVRRNG